MRSLILLLVGCLCLGQINTINAQVVQYVDPFIGSEGEGNVFVGACLPHGMVKLGPDMKGHSNSGYVPGGLIEGFSHVHVSGTGGGAKYGNIMITPALGAVNLDFPGSSFSEEKASPGYYAVNLDEYDIKAELTVTHKAGFHEYHFPEHDEATLLFDAGHFLFFGDQWGEAQELVGSEIEVLSSTEIKGYNRVRHGWNFGGPYTVYVYAMVDKPAKSFGTWKNKEISEGKKIQYDTGEKTGAWFKYATEKDETIRVKVGISFISTLKARENLEKDIPHWDFNKIKGAAEDEWNSLLKKISIDAPEKQKRIFYTSMYHAFLMPVDRTGENPKWQSEIPYYDDFYAIWDTYRTPHPLMTILTPDRQVEMVNALLDIYKYDGYTPDGRSGNYNGRLQGGTNADILIWDAYTKGLKGINYELGLESMLKNATEPPGGNQRAEGRGGLRDYNELGYISTDYERAGSRTLEYAYCDFAIANLSKQLGKEDLAKKYFQKANNWQNLWDADYESHGSKGFIMPKKANGEWHKDYVEVNRAANGGDTIAFDEFTWGYWNFFFYESHSWEYSLFVPHDVSRLIELSGGNEAFIQRLDTFFYKDFFRVSNEPGFLTPHLYTYAGVQSKTAHRVNKIIKSKYKDTRDGIPGNDDSGSMGAWYVFNAMGFYPNAGQNVYLIGSPQFEKTVISLPNGKNFTILAKDVNDENIYIQSAKLNGQDFDKAWLRYEDIMSGGELVFKMDKKPTEWGEDDLPPSMSD